jgi:hypothetical protein
MFLPLRAAPSAVHPPPESMNTTTKPLMATIGTLITTQMVKGMIFRPANDAISSD